MEDILTFTAPEHRWLSNMTYVNIEYNGKIYPSTENFYQAMKYKSELTRKLVSTLKPYDAKRYSKNNIMTNDKFEDVKLKVMLYAQRKKYSQEPFKSKLLSTGYCLIEEGNWWGDKFWGVDIKTREGENHLGKIIMQVREELRNDDSK